MLQTGLALRHDRHNITQQEIAIRGFDDQLDLIGLLLDILIPFHRNQPLLFVYNIRAVGGVP